MPNVIPIDTRQPLGESPEQVFERTKAREIGLSRMLVAYIVTGLAFMLLPGTFLGVWNLISITSHRAAQGVSATWIQAHGHAQIFGWIGSFILGIGFYSIPTVRKTLAMRAGWLCYGMWTAGVLLRWLTNVYLWHWRALLPASAILELVAFLIFFRAVSQHEAKDSGKSKLENWVWVVIIATIGFLAALVMNAGLATCLGLRAASPAIPPAIDARFLVLCTWGFLVPFVWGFSNKWLPIFLGLQATNSPLLFCSVALNVLGVISALFGHFYIATLLTFHAAVFAILALKLFQRPEAPAKTKGVHGSFPVFVRSAYLWLLVAALLSIWASRAENASGIWGASRHALTVGFLGIMVFSIGQRVLPAFSGMKLLFSTKLMFLALAALTLGCALRVSSEVLAYQDYAAWAWKVLPISALLELTAVTLFATNLVVTFARRPAHLLRQSSLVAAATLLRKES
ncbi:MAG TPA: NnrS family protein [Terriglobales bacterium]|nr:NnrS family protein [Terriglobales bacterium]